ncbi:Antitoxin HicB [Oligella sp. MSHR50489EDL]|uniref:type II toxin-antitoxin system HicB family antitoxin n=1 Tax=Oligella sp. MSHR50489EDL TaxID=3139409 RepID=UPI003D816D74
MLTYPVTLTPDSNGTFFVGFPDIPEANSVGEDIQEALINAEEALEAALEIYFDERRAIPKPSKVDKEGHSVTLPALVTAKVLLMNEMIEQQVRKAELARRLEVHMPQVDRLLDLRHSTKLEFIERAYKKLGKQISVDIC